MELKFLGRGSAFCPQMGNNSAFFTEKENLFLIDCGENIFERILKAELLQNKPQLYIFITHTHPDHVGSLGSLLFYMYYACQKKAKIVLASDKQKKLFEKYFSCIGVREEHYEFILPKDIENLFSSFSSVEFYQTQHSKGMLAYNIAFKTSGGVVFYSGDTGNLKNLKRIMKSESVEKIYTEAQPSSSNVDGHLKISTIEKELAKVKEKIFLMHLNPLTMQEAKEKGFKLVETIFD